MKRTRRLSRSPPKPSEADVPASSAATSGRRSVRAPSEAPVVSGVASGPVSNDRRPTVRLGKVKAPGSIPPAARRTVPNIPVTPMQPTTQLTHTQPSFARPAAGAPPPVRSSRSALTKLSFDAVAYVTLTTQEIKKRPLDPHQAFVIALIDGRTSIESVLDTCPLSTHQVLRILGELLREGVIAVR